MPIKSKFKLEKIYKKVQEAKELEKKGYSGREIASIMRRSHTWVWNALNNKIPAVDKFLEVANVSKE